MKKLLVVGLILVSCSTNLFAGRKRPVVQAPPAAPPAVVVPVERAPAIPGLIDPVLVPADEVWNLILTGRINEAQSKFLALNDPEAVDSRGRSFQHQAADAGNLQLADFFQRQGVPVDTKDGEGRMPLSIATDEMNAGLAAFFVRAGASIHNTMPQGNTTAMKAIAQNDRAFLEAILTASSLASTDTTGRTVIHLAAEQGNLAALETIIEAAGFDYIPRIVNTRDLGGRTALDIAYAHKDSEAHADCARALIMGGGTSADPFNSYFSPAIKSFNYNLRSANSASPLHYAVQEGYSGYIRFLLRRNADPNITNADGETPLHTAMKRGEVPVIRMIIDGGAKVDVQDARGNSPMHIAVSEGVHDEAIAVLLEARANPNLRDENGNTPLQVFVFLNRSPLVIETLLKGGASVASQNNEGKTALFIAVEEKRIALIPALLNYGSDIFSPASTMMTPFGKALADNGQALPELITEKTVRSTDMEGNTPLHVAMRANASIDVIRMILGSRAEVNAQNKEGDSVLHLAVRNNQADIGTLLLDSGADIFLANARAETPLFLTFYASAGSQHAAREIRMFMLNPAVMSARDGLGNTVLHHATMWKIDSVIPAIVERGANTEAVNTSGETPLFIAVKANAASTVRALLGAGASLTGRDSLGNTALHTAVRSDAPQATEALLDANSSIDAYNLYGQTPLHDAVRLGSYNAQIILVRRGANIEMRDNEGNTPLLLAVRTGTYRAAEHLITSGGDINTRNSTGNTALHIAVRDERSDLAMLLLQNGAQIYSLNADGESPFSIALSFHDDRNQAGASRMVSTLLTTDRARISDDEGRSALHIAVMRNMSVPKLEIIVNQGGKVNSVEREGRTPLRIAVDMDNWEAAKYLVGAGSDVFSVARDGRSPAEIALGRGAAAIRAVFSGKAIVARDSSGNTILHYAARTGNRDQVSLLLLELGADRNIRNTAGESAADIASRWGNTAVYDLLR
ncbi:MAG: ankyrin repeat domain-containing protein [Spirochaetaceae bacterium]|jgi:ankyrin repeat protein|nr:ankyrin repeat domain-containing protein [Spirochaetaceae bacterium]